MTVKSFFNWTIGLPIAALAIGFAVANRQWVIVSFDPINRTHPFATLALPLWGLLFAGILIGIFAGWLVAWLGNASYRRATKEAKIELIRTQQAHERERRELQQNLPALRQDQMT